MQMSGGGKAEVLQCACLLSGCWPFLARIESSSTEVVWSEFEQPHRADTWSYVDFGPFVFNREEYEAGLAALKE